jgi:predicted Zn-dependent protease
MQARYVSAGQGNNFNSATNTYTASGKAEMASALTAWQRYLQLTNTPDPNMAIVAARAYDAIAQYKNEAAAWQIVTAANPSVPTYYEDLAVAEYQAKNANLGDLAAAKAVSLAPKSTRAQLRAQLTAIRSQTIGSATPTSTPTTTAATTTTAPAKTPAKGKSHKKK